jgi:hypothetical protein
MSVIFFDNDMNHVQSMTRLPNCTSIRVDDSQPNTLSNGIPNGYRDYFARLGNTYAINVVQKYDKKPDLTSHGFTSSEHIPMLYDWLSRTRGVKIAAFDWDRTITNVEGMIVPKYPINYSDIRVPNEDVILYLLGGPERVDEIRRMFAELHRNDVNVFIITSNGNCINRRDIFLSLLKVLDPLFIDENLICSYGANKYTTFKDNSEYKKLMGNSDNEYDSSGGKKKSKRSKTSKKSKKLKNSKRRKAR